MSDPMVVRCTIEMELVEGRDFKMNGRRKREFILERAQMAFMQKLYDLVWNPANYDYIQAKILDEPTRYEYRGETEGPVDPQV